MNTNTIHTADSLDKLDELPEESFHAVVTDPPYGLAFMGRDWDDFEPKEYQEWCERWARECKRVLKPGGHLLAFSGNRTHHRLFTGVEDAGFEIRDTLTWHYGSGFPKAADMAKVIDKRKDVDREVVGTEEVDVGMQSGSMHAGREQDVEEREKTVATSPEAKEWDGWKTGLKPATEFVVLARKPFGGATVDCVLSYGTGALNIDACRIDVDGERVEVGNRGGDVRANTYDLKGGEQTGTTTEGRYPSNVVFDEPTAGRLDRKNDTTVSTGGERAAKEGHKDERHNWKASDGPNAGGVGDEGGVSRYFYTSKASKSERTENGSIDNSHPTVKPLDLMEWLIKLVTKEGQTILDPFAGSGTTCKAAKGLNREFVGIEKQPQWADVARVRCGLTPYDPSNVRGDSAQRGLESYE